MEAQGQEDRFTRWCLLPYVPPQWCNVVFAILFAVGLALSLCFAQLSLLLVLSSLLFALLEMVLSRHAWNQSSGFAGRMPEFIFTMGLFYIQAWIPGVGIWEVVFYCCFNWAVTRAAGLLVYYRQLKAGS